MQREKFCGEVHTFAKVQTPILFHFSGLLVYRGYLLRNCRHNSQPVGKGGKGGNFLVHGTPLFYMAYDSIKNIDMGIGFIRGFLIGSGRD